MIITKTEQILDEMRDFVREYFEEERKPYVLREIDRGNASVFFDMLGFWFPSQKGFASFTPTNPGQLSAGDIVVLRDGNRYKVSDPHPAYGKEDHISVNGMVNVADVPFSDIAYALRPVHPLPTEDGLYGIDIEGDRQVFQRTDGAWRRLVDSDGGMDGFVFDDEKDLVHELGDARLKPYRLDV